MVSWRINIQHFQVRLYTSELNYDIALIIICMLGAIVGGWALSLNMPIEEAEPLDNWGGEQCYFEKIIKVKIVTDRCNV